MLSELFDSKNVNLVVGVITFLIVIWLMAFAIPSLFVSLFNTALGNFILLGFIILTGMYNTTLAFGLAFLFFFLFRFSHMSATM
jgi:DNA-binding transcriptional regulator of glucitol operon